MPPTNILFGISVPYFGTDGENVTGVIGIDMSIINYKTDTKNSTLAAILLYKCSPYISAENTKSPVEKMLNQIAVKSQHKHLV